MCGRFALTHSFEEMIEWYNLILPESGSGTEGFVAPPPRYNIAPTQPIMMLANEARGPAFTLVRWGLVPGWVKDPKDFTLLVNARSETAAEKPSFRSAMRHRRTLVPASGFYEWRRKGKKSQPFWVRPRDGGLMTIAGLMETWSDADGSEIDTGCLLTTRANDSFSKIHHRLPVIIQRENFERWLDCFDQEPRDMVDLMQPANDDYLEVIPVSDLVNKVANSGPDVQTPIELQQEEKIEKEKQDKKPDDDQLSMF